MFVRVFLWATRGCGVSVGRERLRDPALGFGVRVWGGLCGGALCLGDVSAGVFVREVRVRSYLRREALTCCSRPTRVIPICTRTDIYVEY